MALGSTYSNNQRSSNTPELTVYSNYRMNNAESQIDATCITFRYWKSNLCIGIFPRKNINDNDNVSFDMDNGITIYLSHTKARILANELKLFLSDPIKYNSVGVPSGQAAISISNGSEYGKNTPVVTIRKVNDNGEVTASFAYEFKTNFYFSIRNYDGKNFDSVYDEYNNLEIEQFITVLEEYIKASTNAIAFTVMDQRKYSSSRIENKIESLAAGLGIDISSNSGSNRARYSGTSYFNNTNSTNTENSYNSTSSNYASATIDDLD